MIYISNLTAINALCVSSGGTGGHYSNLRGINELVTILGGSTTYRNDLAGINALVTLSGGTGNYHKNLDALNALIAIIGGDAQLSNRLAWSEIANIGLGAVAPAISDQTFTIPENSANWTEIGTVIWTGGGTIDIISGNESGAFAIDFVTGVITVADVDVLDFENPVGSNDYDRDDDGDIIMADNLPVLSDGPGNAYLLTVRVTNSGGTADADVCVCVTNVAEYSFETDEDFLSRLQGLITKEDGFTYLEDQDGTNDAKLVGSLCSQFGSTSLVGLTNTAIKDNLLLVMGETLTVEFDWKFDGVSAAWAAMTNNVLLGCGGYGNTTKRGFTIGSGRNVGLTANRFKLVIDSDIASEIISFDTDIAPDVRHIFKFAINLTDMNIKLYIDGTDTETKNITTGGGRTTWATGTGTNRPSGFVLGAYTSLGASTSAKGWLSNFKAWKDSTLSVHIPFSVTTLNNKPLYDRVTKVSMSFTDLTHTTQDYYHQNILNGFALFYQDGATPTPFYVPRFADGTYQLLVTGFTKIGDYPAGNYHNRMCETLVTVETGVTKTGEELSAYPYKRFFPLDFSLTKVNNIVVFSADKTEAMRNEILTHFEVEIQDLIIQMGDSLFQGVQNMLVADLPTSPVNMKTFDYSFCKIYDIAANAVQDMAISESAPPAVNNTDQPQVADGRFSLPLTYAFAKGSGPLYIGGSRVSGTLLYTTFTPTGTDVGTLPEGVDPPGDLNLLRTYSSITALAKSIMSDGKYPNVIVQVSLLSNDANSVFAASVANITMPAMINHFRATIDQTCEFWWVRPHSSDYPTINGVITSVVATLENIFTIDQETAVEDYWSGDGVHPSITGMIHMGSYLLSGEHE